LDNYDEPNAMLTGSVVYQGEPVGVRTNGVELELWQPSFELNQKIPVHVAQDGTFSASIFSGDYEIGLLPGNGPWVNNTTRIPVSVNGTATIDIPVTPYYTVENEQFSLNGASGPSGAVTATFNIGQIETSRQVEFVGLYVGETIFVDPTNRRVQVTLPLAQIADLNAPINLSVDLPADIDVTPSPAPREAVFARIGVKTVGVSEMLFSPVMKIDIN
jgi:hypothetical protein